MLIKPAQGENFYAHIRVGEGGTVERQLLRNHVVVLM